MPYRWRSFTEIEINNWNKSYNIFWFGSLNSFNTSTTFWYASKYSFKKSNFCIEWRAGEGGTVGCLCGAGGCRLYNWIETSKKFYFVTDHDIMLNNDLDYVFKFSSDLYFNQINQKYVWIFCLTSRFLKQTNLLRWTDCGILRYPGNFGSGFYWAVTWIIVQ